MTMILYEKSPENSGKWISDTDYTPLWGVGLQETRAFWNMGKKFLNNEQILLLKLKKNFNICKVKDVKLNMIALSS